MKRPTSRIQSRMTSYVRDKLKAHWWNAVWKIKQENIGGTRLVSSLKFWPFDQLRSICENSFLNKISIPKFPILSRFVSPTSFGPWIPGCGDRPILKGRSLWLDPSYSKFNLKKNLDSDWSKIVSFLIYGNCCKLQSWSVSHFLIWLTMSSKWLCHLVQISSSQIRLRVTWIGLYLELPRWKCHLFVSDYPIHPFDGANDQFLIMMKNYRKSGKLKNFRPTFEKFKPFEDLKIWFKNNRKNGNSKITLS